MSQTYPYTCVIRWRDRGLPGDFYHDSRASLPEAQDDAAELTRRHFGRRLYFARPTGVGLAEGVLKT